MDSKLIRALGEIQDIDTAMVRTWLLMTVNAESSHSQGQAAAVMNSQPNRLQMVEEQMATLTEQVAALSPQIPQGNFQPHSRILYFKCNHEQVMFNKNVHTTTRIPKWINTALLVVIDMSTSLSSGKWPWDACLGQQASQAIIGPKTITVAMLSTPRLQLPWGEYGGCMDRDHARLGVINVVSTTRVNTIWPKHYKIQPTSIVSVGDSFWRATGDRRAYISSETYWERFCGSKQISCPWFLELIFIKKMSCARF